MSRCYAAPNHELIHCLQTAIGVKDTTGWPSEHGILSYLLSSELKPFNCAQQDASVPSYNLLAGIATKVKNGEGGCYSTLSYLQPLRDGLLGEVLLHGYEVVCKHIHDHTCDPAGLKGMLFSSLLPHQTH